MFNLTSAIAKQRFWRTQNALMNRLENVFAIDINEILEKQYILAANSYIKNKTFKKVINAQTNILKNLLKKEYKKVGLIFANQTFSEVEIFKSILLYEEKGRLSNFLQDLNTFIRLQTGTRITQINSVTKLKISRIVLRGQRERRSVEEIAQNIIDAGHIQNGNRALKIAKTEVHSIAVFSTDTAVKKTGLEFIREWLSANDPPIVRDTHLLASGQQRRQNESFIVGGEKLRFPGDPRGSAGNIIYCRCVLIYNSKES